MIAPNRDDAAAMLLAEGIRRTIEKNQLKNLGLPKLLTARIGVADLTHKQQNGKELIIKDDEALYYVKANKSKAKYSTKIILTFS